MRSSQRGGDIVHQPMQMIFTGRREFIMTSIIAPIGVEPAGYDRKW